MYENCYHEGELAVQARAGETDIARMTSRAIAAQMPGAALPFIAQQNMLVIASVDRDGQLYCSIIFGERGFMRASDARTIVMDLKKIGLSNDDPMWDNLSHNSSVGILIIELATRRRLRVNGNMYPTADGCYRIDVVQAYPNCPKYIQRRATRTACLLKQADGATLLHGNDLSAAQRQIISSADTFFVASAHRHHSGNYSLDTSHRGGPPGFVQILNNNLLRIPDYSGNSMFNTLGNFVTHPHAGLLFIDFTQHSLLQLSGSVEILWPQHDDSHSDSEVQRYWQFEIHNWWQSPIPFDISWEAPEPSPFNP